MAYKSWKPKGTNYIDSSSIMHDRKDLKTILNGLKSNDLYFGVSTNTGKYFKLFSFKINTWTYTFCKFSVVATNTGGGFADCAIGIYSDSGYLGSNSNLYIKGLGSLNANNIVAYQNGTTVTVYYYSQYQWTLIDFKLDHFHSTKNYSYSIGDGSYVSSVSGTKMNTVS